VPEKSLIVSPLSQRNITLIKVNRQPTPPPGWGPVGARSQQQASHLITARLILWTKKYAVKMARAGTYPTPGFRPAEGLQGAFREPFGQYAKALKALRYRISVLLCQTLSREDLPVSRRSTRPSKLIHRTTYSPREPLSH
jgi:hypothetical protein